MKLKKRILSLVLALIMAVPTGLCAFAEQAESEVINESILPLSSKEFQALFKMGMIGEDIASLTASAPISRAQFAGSLFKVAGYTAVEYKTSEIPFIDVNAQTAYKDEICTFYEMGIINGTSENTFSPDEKITYAQAAKLILDVCGYAEYTKVKYGNTLDGYVAMAMYVDLSSGIDGISPYKKLTAEQAVKLLYNAGRTKIVDPTGYTTGGEAFYETTSSKTLFEKGNNLYYGEGDMQSNGIVSLVLSKLKDGIAVIDEVEYLAGGLDLSSFVGFNVEFYYKNEQGIKTLVWVSPSEDNQVLVIDAYELRTDSPDYTMKNIVYRRNNKKQQAKLAAHADIIYNNSLFNNADIDKLKPRMGKISLIDNNGDRTYDVVIVEEFINVFAKGIVLAVNTITDKYGSSIHLDDYEEVRIYRNGEETELAELKINTVISVVADINKKIIILYLNDDALQGSLISTVEDSEGCVYEFDNGTRTLSRSYIDIDETSYNKINPVIGGTYKYYLDKDGKIAEITTISEGDIEYAYLITAAPSTERNAPDNAADVKMLLLNGNIVIAGTRKNIKINGVKGKTGADILSDPQLYDENGEIMEQVVRVMLDDDGNIKEFEFAKDNTTNEYGHDPANFSLDYSGSNWHGSVGSILRWGKFIMDSQVKIFVKYEGFDIEDPYAVLNGSTISTGTRAMKLYDCDSAMNPAVASTTVSGGGSTLTGQCLVSDVFHKRIGDETVKCLGVYHGSNYVEYPEFATGVIPNTVKRGDIVTLKLYKSQITAVTTFVSLSERPAPKATGSYPSDTQIFGYIYDVTARAVAMLSPDTYVSGYGKVLPIPLANYLIPVTIYDVENDEIFKGTWDDLAPSAQQGVDGSLLVDGRSMMAVVHSTNYKVYDIVLVKY